MDPEEQPQAAVPAPPAELPEHIVVLLDAELPDDLSDRGSGHATTVLDLRTADVEQLRCCARAGEPVARVTLVVPGWSHLRLAAVPARLLPETHDLLVRMTEDPSHLLRRTATAGLRMKGLSVRWSSTDTGQLDLHFALRVPRTVDELLHATVGWDIGPLHLPLRIGIADRALEPFVVGNPHARYMGVDDVRISAGNTLTAVDVVLERAATPQEVGVGPPTEGGLPTLKVLADWAGGVRKLYASRADPALVVPPVDTWLVNPSGFEAHNSRRTGRTELAEDGAATDIVSLTDRSFFRIRTGAPLTRRQVHQARRLRFVRTVPQGHATPVAEARLLTQLAAAGVPIVARALSPAVKRLLGRALVDALEDITPNLLADPLRREAASIRLRRAALRHHGAGSRMRGLAQQAGMRVISEPLVSVVLVTKRPAFLSAALAQIARQTWDRLEVVLGLHGDEFAPSEVDRAVAAFPRPISVVRVPADRTFGEALNDATSAASGTYVTKWDDDDLYGSDHVLDLLLAADYSGATVVGKGREFILLDDLGTIVRGTNRTMERMVRFVAGGTLLFQRHILESLGGWRPLPFAVDQAFLRQVLDAGGTVYRTHGFGYILRRHGDAHGHTWNADHEYFLAPGVPQWPAEPELQSLVLETDLTANLPSEEAAGDAATL